jgi:pyruvate/2-oxoglutarate dehydrogenase complex dihydrolipoamide dehydrogenase (E3) component
VQAAKLGKSVLVVEKGRRVGGVSVHTGTIPSKTLRETVLNLIGLARARLLRPLLPGQAGHRRQAT